MEFVFFFHEVTAVFKTQNWFLLVVILYLRVEGGGGGGGGKSVGHELAF